VRSLLEEGVARAEIARRLGISKSTVSYHARRLGEIIDERCRRRYDWSVVQAFYDEGHSMRECRAEFGFSHATWHEAVKRGVIRPRPGFRPVDEIFARNTRRNRGHLKQRLLRLGVKSEHCDHCGLAHWRGRSISMALHHINGDRLDNRLENLELLCPNCHSQTDTCAGRNGRRKSPHLRLITPGETLKTSQTDNVEGAASDLP
jgi:AcrR family transcriptional regulator